MALDFGYAWRRVSCPLDLFSLCKGVHTASENHSTTASFYCDSPRIKYGVTLKCAFNFVLYILRFHFHCYRLDSYIIAKPSHPYQVAHSSPGVFLLVPPVYIAT